MERVEVIKLEDGWHIRYSTHMGSTIGRTGYKSEADAKAAAQAQHPGMPVSSIR